MKTVFSNHMVAHVWAQQNQSEGRSHNGNFSFQGATIFSYSTPIARFTKGKKGQKVLLRTSESYSITTTGKHESAIGRAINYGQNADYRTFHVPFLGYSSYIGQDDRAGTHEANLAHMLNKGREFLSNKPAFSSYSARMRNRGGGIYNVSPADTSPEIMPYYLWNAVECFESAREYADIFGLELPSTLDSELENARGEFRARWIRFNDPRSIRKRELAALARERAKERQEQAAREANAANLARHFAEWQGGQGPRPRAFDYAPGSPERLAIEIGEQAEREQAGREASEAFALWQAGSAPRPNIYHRGLTDGQREVIRADLAREADQRNEAKRIAWLAGEPVQFHGYMPDGTAYARALGVERDSDGQIIGGTLETSLGARVPLQDAIRVFRILRAVKARGEAWHANGSQVRVGSFRVDSIEPDGSFRAGCHKFAYGEVERLALALGIADLAPLAI